jgi:hypothetical protein
MTDDRTDEWPDELARLSPQKAPADLRPRVLTAVSEALSAATNTTDAPKRRKPRWERTLELATAASLLIGIGMNLWQARPDATWREQAVRRALEAKAITAKQPDGSAARAIAHADAAKADARTSWERYHQLLRDLAATTATFKL